MLALSACITSPTCLLNGRPERGQKIASNSWGAWSKEKCSLDPVKAQLCRACSSCDGLWSLSGRPFCLPAFPRKPLRFAWSGAHLRLFLGSESAWGLKSGVPQDVGNPMKDLGSVRPSRNFKVHEPPAVTHPGQPQTPTIPNIPFQTLWLGGIEGVPPACHKAQILASHKLAACVSPGAF